MNNYFNSILEITPPITFFLAVIFLLSPIIKKAFVIKWRYFIWLFVGLRLLLPFKIRIFKPVLIEIPEDIYINTSFISEDLNFFEQNNAEPGNVLFMVWILGVVLYTTFQFICYIRFSCNIKRWQKTPHEEVISIYKEFNMPTERLKICKFAKTPMVFGIFRPIIILPHERYTEDELRIILSHEITHYKNHDTLYKLLLLFACAVHWFNPLVYKMQKIAAYDLEFNCDNEVVKNKGDDFRRKYCHVIVSLIRLENKQIVPCSTNFALSKKVLYERFYGILEMKSKKQGIVLFIMSGIFVILCGGMIEYVSEKVINSTPVVSEIIREIKRPVFKEQTSETIPESIPALTSEIVRASQKPAENTKRVKASAGEVTEESLVEPQKTGFEDIQSMKPEQTVEEDKEALESISKEDFSVYSVDKNSVGITVLPEMEDYVYPFEFTGSDSTMLGVGCISGECGFQIINAETGELVADNSEGSKTNITAEFDGENSYYLRVFSKGDDVSSIYVYQE